MLTPTPESEGRVYLASWKRKKDTYVLWLLDYSLPEVSAPDFSLALENLQEMILMELGDGEAIVEFDRDEPDLLLPAQFCTPNLFSLSGNDSCEQNTLQHELYEKGYCKKCGAPIGKRTSVKAVFDYIPDYSDGAICNTTGRIFSEEFLSLLTSDELNRLKFIEVINTYNRRVFYEFVEHPAANYIGVKDLGGLIGNQCDGCGQICFGYFIKNDHFNFIALSDLPVKYPDIFSAGENVLPDLCVSAKRRREILASKYARNITSSKIGVVKNNNLIERNPIPSKYDNETLMEMQKTFEQKVKDCINNNQRIKALKLIRAETKCNLMEAKAKLNDYLS